MSAGWVYVLASAQPDVFKIGMTSRTPSHREIELAADRRYSAFAPYRMAWKIAVPDSRRVEANVHRMLSDYRIRSRGARELFRVDQRIIIDVIEAVANGHPSSFFGFRLPRMSGIFWRATGAVALLYLAAVLLR